MSESEIQAMQARFDRIHQIKLRIVRRLYQASSWCEWSKGQLEEFKEEWPNVYSEVVI